MKKSFLLLTYAEEIQPHTCYIFSNGDFTLSNNCIDVTLLDKIKLYRLRRLFTVFFLLFTETFSNGSFQEFVISSLLVLCGMSKPDKAFKSGRGGR